MSAQGNSLDGTQPTMKLGSGDLNTAAAPAMDDSLAPRARLGSTSSEKSIED